MRYRLRTLLIVLAVVFAMLPGCSEYSKAKQIHRGAEGVEQHAKEIEDAAATQP